MEVKIVYWCEYVPDCPADAEVTSDELLGVFQDDSDFERLASLAREVWKRGRIRVDSKGDGAQWDGPVASCTDEEFVEYYDGYFADRGPFTVGQVINYWPVAP